MFKVRYKKGKPDFIEAESYESDGFFTKFHDAAGKEVANVNAGEIVSITHLEAKSERDSPSVVRLSNWP